MIGTTAAHLHTHTTQILDFIANGIIIIIIVGSSSSSNSSSGPSTVVVVVVVVGLVQY